MKRFANNGEIADPWGVPRSRSTRTPSGCCIGAVSHRRTYRRHTIPNPVQVLVAILFELGDRHLVHSGRTLIGLDPLKRLPHHPLWKYQTACPATSVRSSDSSRPRWLIDQRTRATHPLHSARITRHHRYYRMVRPPARIGTPPLTVSAAWSSPSRRPLQHEAEPIGARRSQVPHWSLNRARATFVPDTTRPVSRHPPGSSQGNNWTLVSMSSLRFRQFNGGSLTFAFSVHT